MLKRLHRLQEKAALERQQSAISNARPFAHLNHENITAKKISSKAFENLIFTIFFDSINLKFEFFQIIEVTQLEDLLI